MLKKIFRVAFILLTSAAITAEGYVIGYADSVKRFSRGEEKIVKVDRLAVEFPTVIRQAQQALQALLFCGYLQQTYPNEYKNVTKVLREGAIFTYTPKYNHLFIAAVVARDPGHIFLTDYFFDMTYEDRVQVLAHEFLHVIRLPSHKELLVRSEDAVYVTAAKCLIGNLQ